MVNGQAEGAEDLEQQRGGGDAVNVVVTEDDERFVAFAGEKEPLDGGGHVGQKKGIGQLFEPRIEKSSNGGRVVEAAVQEALSEERRDAQLIG